MLLKEDEQKTVPPKIHNTNMQETIRGTNFAKDTFLPIQAFFASFTVS